MTQNIKTELTREDLRQAQKIMLYIMKRIHKVCVEHNIKYWLDYGTLLGAIRHDGFIPWDDDMDICMMREDYEKFCKIAQDALGEEFFLQTDQTDNGFCCNLAKVRLNGTLWLEKSWQGSSITSKGLFVDIHPHDPFPKSKISTFFLTKFATLCNICLFYKRNKAYSCKLINKIIIILSFAIFGEKFFRRWLNRTPEKLRKLGNQSPMVSKLFDTTIGNWCPCSVFDRLVLKKFEDSEFYIPEQYDIRLSRLYGNYMTPPPMNECSGHHNVVEFDFGKYGAL